MAEEEEENEDAIELDLLDSDGGVRHEDLDLEPKEEQFFNAEHIELAGNFMLSFTGFTFYAARERTFDAAYTRSALSTIAIGVFIYRVFSDQFAPVAITYVIFGGLVGIVSIVRRRTVAHGRFALPRNSKFTESAILTAMTPENGLSPEEPKDEGASEQAGKFAQKEHDSLDRSLRSRVKAQKDVRQREREIALENSQRLSAAADKIRKLEQERITRSFQTPLNYVLVEPFMGVIKQCIIPFDTPKQALSHEYFKWRSRRTVPPSMPYFYTSGSTVMVLTILTVITEILVLIFILL